MSNSALSNSLTKQGVNLDFSAIGQYSKLYARDGVEAGQDGANNEEELTPLGKRTTNLKTKEIAEVNQSVAV